MLQSSKYVLLLGAAALCVGFAPASFAHPHDDAASHQAEHGYAEPAGGVNAGATTTTMDAVVETGGALAQPDTQDFNIEDFLDANGQVNLEKLRAYEAGEPWKHIGTESVSDTVSGGMGNGQADVETDVMIIPQDQIIFIPEGEDLPPDMMGSTSDIQVYDFSDTTTPQRPSQSSSQQTIIKMMGDEDVRWTEETSQPDRGQMSTRTIRVKKDKSAINGERSISLSGETTIKIDRDGGVTIVNNGQSVIPLEMKAGQTGTASAMVMDGDAPAKIKVQKTVEIENGERKTRVIIDMEGGSE